MAFRSSPTTRSWTTRAIVTAALLLGWASGASALRALAPLASLEEDEREVLETIALRPPELREAALEAAQYPDVLVELQIIQARSSAAFDALLDPLDRADQEVLWEMVRAPGLVGDLLEGGPKTARQLDAIAARYPDSLREPIRHYGGDHRGILEDIDAIHERANADFERAVEDLPGATRDAFAALVDDPELTSMLGHNVRIALDLGEAYRDDPERLRARLAAIAIEAKESRAIADADWQRSLEEDPEALAELESAAAQYAADNNYEYDELTGSRVETHVSIHIAPYPYWYGYPSWYAGWYPWGYWYPVLPHFGFYYGSGYLYGHHAVFFGLPSLPFWSWFYDRHHTHYPRLARHFDRHRSSHHAYGHRRANYFARARSHRDDRRAHLGGRDPGPFRYSVLRAGRRSDRDVDRDRRGNRRDDRRDGDVRRDDRGDRRRDDSGDRDRVVQRGDRGERGDVRRDDRGDRRGHGDRDAREQGESRLVSKRKQAADSRGAKQAGSRSSAGSRPDAQPGPSRGKASERVADSNRGGRSGVERGGVAWMRRGDGRSRAQRGSEASTGGARALRATGAADGKGRAQRSTGGGTRTAAVDRSGGETPRRVSVQRSSAKPSGTPRALRSSAKPSGTPRALRSDAKPRGTPRALRSNAPRSRQATTPRAPAPSPKAHAKGGGSRFEAKAAPRASSSGGRGFTKGRAMGRQGAAGAGRGRGRGRTSLR